MPLVAEPSLWPPEIPFVRKHSPCYSPPEEGMAEDELYLELAQGHWPGRFPGKPFISTFGLLVNTEVLEHPFKMFTSSSHLQRPSGKGSLWSSLGIH